MTGLDDLLLILDYMLKYHEYAPADVTEALERLRKRQAEHVRFDEQV
jgi:hypothetical protein